jgi:hypothetical protein
MSNFTIIYEKQGKTYIKHEIAKMQIVAVENSRYS